ncbi:MAG: hypothetical protein H7Z72_14375 [Bacteroidetes bacterium]|nr:hypothetical protein [Fibrella sp.]
MTYDAFTESLSSDQPPIGLAPIPEALWYDAKGQWAQAHEIAQQREGVADHDHLHAYLHRKEGDQFNASYWYRRANVPVFVGSLEEEWRNLVRQYL